MRPLMRVLAGEVVSPPPIWLMRQAGRYLPEYRATRARAGDFLSLCLTPDLAAEVTLQPIRRYGFDASIVFADILLVPYALGCGLRFDEGVGPILTPVRSGLEIAALKPAEAVHEALSPVCETLTILRRELPESCALIGFAGAPWTVATYMVEGRGSPDQARTKLFAYREPEVFSGLITRLVDASVAYLSAQVRAGAEVLQIFESWAQGLSEAQFLRWCVAPAREIVARVKAEHPDVRIIGFPRGAGPLAIRYAAETGVDALGLDTGMPISHAVQTRPLSVALQGNLDPLVLVAGGEALRDAVGGLLRGMHGVPHIFNLGHGILPQTPPEHVDEMIALVRGGGA